MLLNTINDLTRIVITADALPCQCGTAAYITDRGGRYIFTVKNNQPSLCKRLKALPRNRFPCWTPSTEYGRPHQQAVAQGYRDHRRHRVPGPVQIPATDPKPWPHTAYAVRSSYLSVERAIPWSVGCRWVFPSPDRSPARESGLRVWSTPPQADHGVGDLVGAVAMPTVNLAIIPDDTDMPLPYMTSFGLFEMPGDETDIAVI